MKSSNPPTIAKRLWHIMQVVYYMLRKGISKRKLILELHLLLKRGKLAGKALGKLLMTFHHHHHHSSTNSKEVEFSCSNTPSYSYYFAQAAAKMKSRRHRRDEIDSFDAAEIAMAFQMMNVEGSDAESMASSALPTPSSMMVRQLRITDSPFPINENELVDVGTIDKEADKFIKRFYEYLKRQQLSSKNATPDNHHHRQRSLASPNLNLGLN